MKYGMTRKMKLCLDFIAGYIDRHGIAPSFVEIQQGLGLKSKSGVHRLVVALEQRGYLIRDEKRARAIAIPETVQAMDDDTPYDVQKLILENSRMKMQIAELNHQLSQYKGRAA